MKPQELYDRKPEDVHNDINILFGCYYNHVPEILDFYGYINHEEIENPRIEIRIIKEFWFDSRRFWRLATVWFDNKPVMVIRNAGREGDDHASRFVTDIILYREMVAYIQTIIPISFTEKIEDEVTPDTDIIELETFYGNTLDGYFERHYY